MDSIVRSNIVANYITSAIVLLAPILALPYYLNAFGPQVWGYISLMMLVQALLGIFDAGASQALVRTFSLELKRIEDYQAVNRALYSYELIYFIQALIVVLIIILATSLFLEGSITTVVEEQNYLVLSFLGGAIFFLFTNTGSVYRSLLIAVNQQLKLGVITSISVGARHLVAVIVVSEYPTLLNFILCHSLFYAIEVSLRGFFAWRWLPGGRTGACWDNEIVKNSYKFVLAMVGSTSIGALTVNADKVVVSTLMSIEDLGVYSIASIFGLGVLQFIYPLLQAFIPKLTREIEDAEATAKSNLHLFLYIVALIAFGWASYFLSGHYFMKLYIGNALVSDQVMPVLTLLLAGSSINAIASIGLVNLVAQGMASKIYRINILLFITTVFFQPLGVTNYGAQGAAAVWIFVNMISVLVTAQWVPRMLRSLKLRLFL